MNYKDVLSKYELIIRILKEGRGKSMEDKKLYVELPRFTGRNVPITEVAEAMHKDAQFVRIGIQQGIFKFGYAMKKENSSEYNYYCPDRKVWEEIGYFSPEAV